MNHALGWMLAAAAALMATAAAGPLAGCASKGSQQEPLEGTVTAQMRSGSVALRAYHIQDWTAPDDRTLILDAQDRSLYEARFKDRCNGLRLVDTVAFVIRGSPEMDHFAGVVLPDGTRCAFSTLKRIEVPVTGSNPSGN